MTRRTAPARQAAIVAAVVAGLAAGCGGGAHAAGAGRAPTTGPAPVTAGPPTPSLSAAPVTATGGSGTDATAGQIAAVNADLAQIDAATDQSDGDFDAGAADQSQNDSP